jgi:BirA family biotin operon repressor/biotin-[acetyl-CoA-carboxylase] ligase
MKGSKSHGVDRLAARLLDPERVDTWLQSHRGGIDGGVAQRVRIVGRLLSGEMISGRVLAQDLGISRAAVHKHIEALRDLGMSLSSAAGSGYRLVPPSDLVCAEAVLPLLAVTSIGLGVPYRYVPTTASTNLLACDGGRTGAPHGTLIVTDYQHTGRGRLGRIWVSQSGSDLTFSLLLRPDLPPERVTRLTLAASVAVAEAAEATLAPGGTVGRVALKWPNDVLIDGRKVCGILSEASLDMDSVHWVVVGIGLNVNGAPWESLRASDLPPGPATPISLREAMGHEIARAPLLVDLLGRLEDRLSRAAGAGWGEVLSRFRDLDALRGRHVEVRAGGAELRIVASGTAGGIGSEGELLVVGEGGAVQVVLSGDATLR